MGGLQREFYDLVGVTMKDQRYRFFQPILQKEEKYHWHNENYSIRDRFRYVRVFGALLANSIANRQILGIEWSTPFLKVLYGEDVSLADLAEIIDTSSYESLRNVSSSYSTTSTPSLSAQNKNSSKPALISPCPTTSNSTNSFLAERISWCPRRTSKPT
jgi:hypothetical protein